MRWGLLSTADINDRILAAADGSVVAVGSRSPERAEAYARAKDIPRAHGSYEALLADEEVDAVYVSVPNGLHGEWTLRALEAGKHVLVEKPFSSRLADVERCFDAAQRRGLVLSEGFMWRHHPQALELERLVGEGAIGELRLVRTSFSFRLPEGDDPRWDPALDGGALMDVGCYCISAARLLAGEPDLIVGAAFDAPSGVDVRFAGTLWFGASGVLATFDCGFDLPGRGAIEAVGSGGTIVLGDPWLANEPVLEVDGEPIEVERADPFRCELDDVEAAITEGRAPRLGRDDAVGQARVLETLLHG